MADLDRESFWNEALDHLRNDLREEEFSGWFSDMKYLRADENSIVVGIPTAFHRDKVNTYYLGNINSKLKEISGKDLSLKLEVIGKEAKNNESAVQETIKKEISSAEKTHKVKQKRGQHPDLRDDFTFDRYIIGENNRFAANAAIATSKNPGKTKYNPLLIFGGVGMGKTHLMQAIGNYIHENTDNKVVFVTSVNFLNDYIEGISQNKMNPFRSKYNHQPDVLLIDDINFFTDKPGVTEQFFHTFVELHGAKKQLIFTCDRPPSELKKFPDRLISRIESGVIVDLQPPRYEERCAILKSTAKNENADISDEVIDFVAKNISSNVRELISAFNLLMNYTELMEKPITLEIAQQRLKVNFYSSRQANLSMDSIIRVTAEYFGLTPNDLKGKKRSQNIVFARQLAMYMGRELMEYSFTEIGQDFGGKDHTTVMYSIDKINARLLKDPSLETTIENLKRSIKEFNTKY